MWFLHNYDGDFGMKVVNCTEGGAMTEGNTTCEVMSLEDKFADFGGSKD